MSGVNAAATLSMEIQTGAAAAELLQLHKVYRDLKQELGSSLPAAGTRELQGQLSALNAEVASLTSRLEGYKGKSSALWISYVAEMEQGRVGAKKALENMTSDQVIELSKQQRNVKEQAAKITKAHGEALAMDRQFNAERAQLAEISQKRDIEIYQTASAEKQRIAKIEQERQLAVYMDGVARLEEISALTQKRDIEIYQAAGAEKARIARIEQDRQTAVYLEGVARLEEVAALTQKRDIELYQAASAEKQRIAKIEQDRQTAVYLEGVARLEEIASLTQKRDIELYQAAAAEKARIAKIDQDRQTQIYMEGVAERERIQGLTQKRDLELMASRLAAQKEAASWASKTPLEQAQAALPAARAVSAGTNASLVHSPGAISMAANFGNDTAKLSAEIERLKNLQSSLGGAVSASASHMMHWNQVANEAHAGARGLSGALGMLWMTYGSMAPLLAGAALAGAMKAVFTVGKDIEYQFSIVKAVTGESTVSLERFGAAVKGSMFSPEQAVQGFRTLAQAGLDTDQALRALPDVLKLATVGETDMGNAALSAASIMHTFGMQVSDIGHIGDVFAKAAAISATSVKEMMEAMKQASSISNVFGVSLEETAAALATLANRGIEGSAAGTAVRNMVKELASPATDKAANALKQFGIQIFNADGSSKSFSENLKQLNDVTSTMSSKSKATFLEDLFNERGAKAANILLSDLDRMKGFLDDIKMSSQGLGFMTEAQITISQSATGMLAAVKTDAQLMFAEIYKEVEPQIKLVISAIGDLVRTGGLKEMLSSIATGVADLSKWLVQHGEVIRDVTLAYIAFKAATTIGSGLIALSGMLTAATASAGSFASALRLLAAGGVGPMIGGTSALATVLGGLSSVMLGPVGIGVAGLIAAYAVWKLSGDGLTDTQRAMINEMDGLVSANDRLVAAIHGGRTALEEQNKELARQIDLMRQGKSAAEAMASAKTGGALEDMKADRLKAKIALDKAQAAVDANPVDQAGAMTKAQEAAFQVRDSARAAFQALDKDVENLAVEMIKAGMAGREKEELGAKKSAEAQIETQNKKLQTMKRQAEEAASAITGVLYGKPEAQEAQRKELQRRIDAGKTIQGLSPLDTSKFEDQGTMAEVRRRDSLLGTLGASYEKAPKKGPAPKLRDTAYTSETAEVDLLKEFEKAKIDILESSHAAKLISEEDYRTKLMAIEGEYEPKILAAYSASLERLKAKRDASQGDEYNAANAHYMRMKLNMEKFEADKALRLQRSIDKEQQIMNSARKQTDEFIAKANTDVAQILEKIKKTREDLDRTPEQRAENDARVSVSKLTDKEIAGHEGQIKYLKGTGLSEESAEIRAQVEAIEKLKAARTGLMDQAGNAASAEAEYQRTFEYGFKKAYQSYTEEATNAAKVGSEVFSKSMDTMSSALEEFVNTGTVNWKKLGYAIVSEIFKIETRFLMSKALGAINGGSGGGGLLSLLGLGGGSGLAGSGGPQTASEMAIGASINAAGMGGFAKGAVFSGAPSLHQYANTVQTTPTYFGFERTHAFAKGGVFAEAGPEAVMPLARDSSGSLGVKMHGAAAAPAPNNIRIVNAFDHQVIGDYIGSTAGEKVIMNMVRKNQATIKQLAR